MPDEHTVIYGIANCDTMKKARAWLGDHQIACEFHDYRKNGLDAELLQTMENELGWENMLNRRGTTWRKLPEEVREQIDRASALQVMLDNPAIVKRPILAHDNHYHVGFNDSQYREIFA